MIENTLDGLFSAEAEPEAEPEAVPGAVDVDVVDGGVSPREHTP